jgi:hypothetical protein
VPSVNSKASGKAPKLWASYAQEHRLHLYILILNKSFGLELDLINFCEMNGNIPRKGIWTERIVKDGKIL